jgi:N,N'-diacetyllegionaminate synthase
MNKPTLIAEIAKAHNGNMDLAKKLIDDAKTAGFDYVKFQAYNIEDIKPEHPNYDRYVQCHLTIEQLHELSRHADNYDIGFYCSAFSYSLIDKLREFIDRIKIPSTFFNVDFFIAKCLNTFKEVHLSTGMNSFDTIIKMYSYYTSRYCLNSNSKLVLYHCVSEYPTAPECAKMNRTGGMHFRGYSDHTSGIEAMLLATIRGVDYIEKHFSTLSTSKKWDANIDDMWEYHDRAEHFLKYFIDHGVSNNEVDNYNFYRKEFKDLSLLEEK